MLNEEQINQPIEVPASHVVLCLRIIGRLNGIRGGILPVEMSAIGTVRDSLAAALQEATGVNFDEAMLLAEQEARQAQVQAQTSNEE